MLKHHTFLKNKLVELNSVSSKTIRDGRSQSLPISLYKSGIISSPAETLNWAFKLSKLSCTRLKNVLLRVAHREYFTKERLHRYGLIDSPICPRCDQVDDYDHKIYNCTYVKKIWKETFKLTDKRCNPPRGISVQSKAVGMEISTDLITLSIHAEIFNRILSLRDEAIYLVRPNVFVKQAVQYLIKREIKTETKRSLTDLLG